MADYVSFLARAGLALFLACVGVSFVIVGLFAKFNPIVLAIGAGMTWWAWKSRPASPNAWRKDEPTERQLAYAKDLGIVVPEGATKGQVSDMISAVTGR